MGFEIILLLLVAVVVFLWVRIWQISQVVAFTRREKMVSALMAPLALVAQVLTFGGIAVYISDDFGSLLLTFLAWLLVALIALGRGSRKVAVSTAVGFTIFLVLILLPNRPHGSPIRERVHQVNRDLDQLGGAVETYREESVRFEVEVGEATAEVNSGTKP